MTDAIKQYVKEIEAHLKSGQATEHTYRAALETLIRHQRKNLTTINEAKRIECGAPDLTILVDQFTIGYIEAKDIGKPLDEIEKSDQLKRYRQALGNLILTDYLEFRWYVQGEFRLRASVGTLERGKLKAVINTAPFQAMLAEFLAQGPEQIGSAADIAQRMAQLTHLIRDMVVRIFERQEASPMLNDLRTALAQTLLPGLDSPERVGEFADIYAQTIAYGLFAARCNHSRPEPFRRLNAAAAIPKTNPFLRRLFTAITGPDLDDEPYVGLVKDLVQLLAHADMAAILADFGRTSHQEDPIVHFYETFLAAYDPHLRELRGVYYTPEPVVSYIVRSVDHLLKSRFDLPQGLIDTATLDYNGHPLPRMLLLDPAVGTGTFLYKVVEYIRQQFQRQGNAGMWSSYVSDHLLKRLYGFELLMVPYAVAHFKLALQLAGQDLEAPERAKWHYDFNTDERLKIYLTNTLEDVETETPTLFGLFRIITEEAKAAATVKQQLPILVVMGNPPYSGHSANSSWTTDQDGKPIRNFIGELLQSYYQVDGKPLGERNSKWLQDDYVKFIRWGQWRIEQTGRGVLAFITNHGYLDNPTFRGMRQSLMHTFDEIYLLDLHGNAKKKEVAPDGSNDENVFDIQQGVAIGLFVKHPATNKNQSTLAQVYHAHLWGHRDHKYQRLAELDITSTEWTEIKPLSPFYLFIPQDVDLLGEYRRGWKAPDIFPTNGWGIATRKDYLLIDFTKNPLVEKFEDIKNMNTEKAIEKYSIKVGRYWDFQKSKESLSEDVKKHVKPILFRPFDIRFVYYEKCMIERGDHRYNLMRNMFLNNLSLITVRRSEISGTPKHFYCTNQLSVLHSTSAKEGNFVFPLYLYPEPDQLFNTSPWPPDEAHGQRTPNLNPDFVADVADRLGLTFQPHPSDDPSDTADSFTPEDIFHYAYAIFHSPTYRERYAEFLKIDFPRLPLTSELDLFWQLVNLGEQLVKLHLMERHLPPITQFPLGGDNKVAAGYPKYTPPSSEVENGRVYINKSQYIAGVPPEIWEFQIGGYQVLHKWLKDRRKRQLSYDDLAHYQNIVVILHETRRLMAEIDDTIPGWPLP